MKKPIDIEEILKVKCNKNTSNGCWEWIGTLNSNGYGIIHYEKKTHLAHRVSYEKHNGPLRKGFLICHKCNNEKCVNPEHLYQGSYRDNSRDMIMKKLGTSKDPMRLREYMGEKNRTNKELAKHLGVSETHIWLISTRRSNPSAQLAYRIHEWTNQEVEIHEIRSCTKTCMPGCPCSKKDK